MKVERVSSNVTLWRGSQFGAGVPNASLPTTHLPPGVLRFNSERHPAHLINLLVQLCKLLLLVWQALLNAIMLVYLSFEM